MKKKRIILVIAAILVVVLIVLASNKKGDGIEVETAKAEIRQIIETVSANGKIQPEAELTISSEVSGEIIEIAVNEGDTIIKGQLLVKINPDIYQTALSRTQSNWENSKAGYKTNQALVNQAAARLKEAEANFNRSKSLKADDVISQSEFDNAQASYSVALEDYNAAKERLSAAQYTINASAASVNEAKQNLSRTTIFAPTDGIVSKLEKETGERVVGTAQMEGTAIMVISNFNNMEVTVDVNENDILNVHLEDTAEIEVDAYDDRKFKGLVTEIARSSKTQAQNISNDQVTNFEVKVRLLKSSYIDLLKQTETPFLPGMSATVDIRTSQNDSALSVPLEAVTTRKKEGEDGEVDEVVFVYKGGVAEQRVVKTGIQNSRYIQMDTGITTKDEIITGPYDAVSRKLTDKDKVEKVKSEKF